MIIAAHVPVGPQMNVPDAPVPIRPSASPSLTRRSFRCSSPPVRGSTPPGVPCNGAIGLDHFDPVPPYTVVTDASLLADAPQLPEPDLMDVGASSHQHRHPAACA